MYWQLRTNIINNGNDALICFSCLRRLLFVLVCRLVNGDSKEMSSFDFINIVNGNLFCLLTL